MIEEIFQTHEFMNHFCFEATHSTPGGAMDFRCKNTPAKGKMAKKNKETTASETSRSENQSGENQSEETFPFQTEMRQLLHI
ncbi:MAG: hypothetical protein V3S64_16035, partial [bacterium]